jgi:hypothetical protein
MEPSEQISLIDVTADPVPLPPPPEKTIYLVVACEAAGYWSVRRTASDHDYATWEQAQAAAERLSSVWHHRRIVAIHLGPEVRDGK